MGVSAPQICSLAPTPFSQVYSLCPGAQTSALESTLIPPSLPLHTQSSHRPRWLHAHRRSLSQPPPSASGPNLRHLLPLLPHSLSSTQQPERFHEDRHPLLSQSPPAASHSTPSKAHAPLLTPLQPHPPLQHCVPLPTRDSSGQGAFAEGRHPVSSFCKWGN